MAVPPTNSGRRSVSSVMDGASGPEDGRFPPLTARVARSSAPPTGSTLSTVTNTVDLWNETLPPVFNELEASTFSPVDYRGEGSLRAYTADVFVLRSIANSQVHLLAGVRIGALDTVQSKGSSERAFIFDLFAPGVHFNNFIDLSTDADSSFRSVGPMAGVELSAEWHGLTIDLAASQAILIGNTDTNGLFTDVDDITSAADPAGPFIECTPALVALGCTRIESNIHFSTSKRSRRASWSWLSEFGSPKTFQSVATPSLRYGPTRLWRLRSLSPTLVWARVWTGSFSNARWYSPVWGHLSFSPDDLRCCRKAADTELVGF
jgi:hypothetical protein